MLTSWWPSLRNINWTSMIVEPHGQISLKTEISTLYKRVLIFILTKFGNGV